MRRACKLTTKFLTSRKRRSIQALLHSYRSAVNYFIKYIWVHDGRLNAETLRILQHTRLSERYKSQALKQALEIISSTQKSSLALGKKPDIPFFKGGATLDAKFISIEPGEKSFDLIIKLSTLNKGHKITIPTRRTAVLNKWMSISGSELIQGISLREKDITVWVEVPNLVPKTEGKILGIDIGVHKLIADSDGKFYGTQFKTIRDKVKRRRPGSNGKLRAIRERDQYINQVVKQLPWKELGVIGVENLRNMKKGKRKNKSKSFRKAMAPWTYRQVLRRVGLKAQENRVLLVAVPPAYTSQRCPACRVVSKENRKGEHYSCRCGYTSDADTVGARNVLDRTLATIGSVESPVLM